MNKIIKKEEIAENTIKLILQAPFIAKKAQAGQFVIVINDQKGERIPLTLADWNTEEGTITLIFQEVGFSTRQLAQRNVGDFISDILGPLGHPTVISKLGRVICVGGGVGIAEIFPVSRAFRQAGNEVIGIIGARSKGLVILEKEMRQACDKLYITTDDGTYNRKGFVTDVLKELLSAQPAAETTSLVYAIGPVLMMRAVSELTRQFNIKTIVSLNPIMLDGTGMCGSCRCTVGGEVKFACVEGPDFDAHQVDFQDLLRRINQFKDQELKISQKN